MSDYKISVVLPAYKVEKYILRALKSLSNQTFKRFEIVFVDDCGGDNSIALIQDYFKNDNRVHIYHNPKNMGTYHARRVGTENARGEYIVFLDPDDELDERFLSILYNHVKDRDYDMVFYDVDYVPQKKWYQSVKQSLPFSNDGKILQNIFSQNGKKTVSEGNLGKTYKRSFLLKIFKELDIDVNYRYVYAEDRLLYYAAILSDPTYAVIGYKGYVYHNNDTSITNKRQQQAPTLQIEQLNFTTNQINELIKQRKLTIQEQKHFDYFLNKTCQKELALLQRYENSGDNYLQHTLDAFKVSPNLKDFLRIVAYITSFKKILL